ncbi:DNA repair protein RecN [Pseudolycoriella hygida]|uniref:DNA repair protein RecN n=1 Tax=Pseudolycoriella hygida TaxID=35572 RepID=A0A9Q0S667_9DIPT|nr:DNA repair protein RecN [Pseudolycoriella hygida]
MKLTKLLFYIITASLILSSCKSKKVDEDLIVPINELYGEGVALLEKRKYSKAAEQFSRIFYQDPGNKATPQAELMQSYSLFLAGQYEEAVDVLGTFIQLHPMHEDIAYAYYLKALCYYMQISSPQLDQSRTLLAKESFEDVINLFPSTRYATDSSLKIDLVNDHLADQLEIEFEKGLCVITGETGAGKSILLEAILFSLGNKFSDNVIKEGCDYCSITTAFTLNNSLKRLLEQFNIEYDEQFNKEANKVYQDKENITEEIDYLTFIIDELTNLNIQQGEEERLTDIRQNLQNQEKEIKTIQDIVAYLEDPALDNFINNAQRLITRNLSQNANFPSIAGNLDDCYNSLEEARVKLQNILNKFEENEFNIEEIEERLFLLRAKARKYNISCETIPQFLLNSRQQLKDLQDKIANFGNLDSKRAEKYKDYLELALALSSRRFVSANKLELAVQKELKQLKMEKAIFKVEIAKKDPITLDNLANESIMHSNGIDNIRFVASTNPGMKLAPIDKIASGGELSRFMLAIKTCIFNKSQLNTIIFDEIDTGIGGIVADKIGERLKNLSSLAQVIVVTHHPQVAGKADQHIVVSKTQYDEETKITIKSLTALEKQTEIARMISGKSITEASLKAAKELLN